MYDNFNIFNEQKNSDQHKKIQNFTNDAINETAQLISNVSIRAAAAASEIMSSTNNQHNFFNSYASCAKDNINNMKNFASALFTSWEKNFMNCNNTVATGKKTSS